MATFTGTLGVKVCEATGLRPTDFQRRHTFGKPDEQLIDPYVTIDVDEQHVAQSTSKPKTFDPVWNEYFEQKVENAKTLTLTVFHDASIPPDDFVANCSIPFEDLLNRDKDAGDFWVSALFSFYICHLLVIMSFICHLLGTILNDHQLSLESCTLPTLGFL